MSELTSASVGIEATLEGAPSTDTRREQLSAALDALPEGQDDAPEPASDGPARGPDGKFASKTPSDPAETTKEAPEPEAPEPWNQPPTSWKKDYHEAFAKADPALRQYITERENQMRQGIEPLIPKAKFADEVNNVVSRYEANIQAAGVPVVSAIQTLMEADNILRNAPMAQKQAYARQLLAQYGVDMGDGSYVEPPPVDPTISALQAELAQVRGTVQTWQQQQQQAEQQTLLSEIQQFGAEHEHFETLKPVMSDMLLKGFATDLKDAYNKALRLDENLFSATQAGSQAQAAEAEKKAAADKAAKTAKAAAVSVKSSTPGSQPPPKAQDRRALLESQLDALNERF